jgi:hypothetical protein
LAFPGFEYISQGEFSGVLGGADDIFPGNNPRVLDIRCEFGGVVEG